MEANINEIKKEVQIMEELYEFIQEIAEADWDTLVDIYDTHQFDYIILENSLKELMEKWLLYNRQKKGHESYEIHSSKNLWKW